MVQIKSTRRVTAAANAAAPPLIRFCLLDKYMGTFDEAVW